MKCDRCHNPAFALTGSWFNTQMICRVCSAEELAHPDADYARTIETQAVLGGNYNYPGVGWPGKGGRVSRGLSDDELTVKATSSSAEMIEISTFDDDRT